MPPWNRTSEASWQGPKDEFSQRPQLARGADFHAANEIALDTMQTSVPLYRPRKAADMQLQINSRGRRQSWVRGGNGDGPGPGFISDGPAMGSSARSNLNRHRQTIGLA